MSDHEKKLQDEELDKVSGGVANSANIGTDHIYHKPHNTSDEGEVTPPLEIERSASNP